MADIVKLIYKGDEMSQGGGSSSLPIKVMALNWTSDTQWAQAILDAVLAWDYVIMKDTHVSWTTTYFYMHRINASMIEFVWQTLNRWVWSTTETVVWEQTWEYAVENRIRIRYSWTTVSSVEVPESTDLAIWIDWYTD